VQIPKLVVFDVDGTLVDWVGNVAPSTVAMLSRLRALGIPIALATGRPLAVAQYTLDHVGGADWMACGNGSVLFEVATGRLLRDRCLPADVVLPVIHGLRSRQPDVLDALPADLSQVRRVIPFHDDYDDRLDELAAMVAELIDDRCQVQFGGLPIVDVSPRGDNKAVALQVLVEHLGVTAADVVAFGDGGNDIEMLQWAGTGVAMGNARPQVQAAANHVTTTAEQGGIAAFLQPLLAGFM
jgi:hydroxymethylpyrimidine pyrophosphatase-like HAD family hydrolase